jgi:hypothetical protein
LNISKLKAVALPDELLINPVKILIVVDLPAPFYPRKAKI